MNNNQLLPKNEIEKISNLQEPINPFVFLPVKDVDNENAYQNEDLTMFPDYILTSSRHRFSNGGMEVITTIHPCPKLKKDNAPVIKEMIKQGKRQKEIAFQLGISQSYVSKLK